VHSLSHPSVALSANETLPASGISSGAEARLFVILSGQEISSYGKYMHLPEEWRRQHHNNTSFLEKIISLCALLWKVLVTIAFVHCVVKWSVQSYFDTSAFKSFFLLLTFLLFVDITNNWPLTEYRFETTEPLLNQQLLAISSSVVGGLFKIFVHCVFIGFVHQFNKDGAYRQTPSHPFFGVALGLCIAGAHTLQQKFADDMFGKPVPEWGSYSGASAYIPALGLAQIAASSTIGSITTSLVLASYFERIGEGDGPWPKGLQLLFAFLLGLISNGASLESIPSFMLHTVIDGVTSFVQFAYVFAVDRSQIPIVMATQGCLRLSIRALQNVYPQTVEGCVLAAICLTCIGYFWHRSLSPNKTQKEHTA